MKAMDRRSFLSGAVALGGLMLAGCGGSAAPSAATSPATSGAAKPAANGSAAAPAKPAASGSVAASAAPAVKPAVPGTASAVKAAWVAITANQMIWPLAVEAGYFEKYGVNFALQYVQGSLTSVQAMQAGDLQMVEAAGSAVVSGRTAKTDIVMTAGFLNDTVWRIMAIPSITSVDQLKGKTVAVTKVGNSDYFAWPVLAKNKGWKDTDFTYVAANNPPGQVALLTRGDAQAAAFSPPNDVQAEEQAKTHLVLDEATLHVPSQQTGMIAFKSYLAQNHETALNVVKASVEAIHRWKTDPAFAKDVIKKYLKTTDQAYIDDGYTAYAPLWPEEPYPSKEGFAEAIAEVSTQDPKSKSITPDECIDNSLVKELVDSGFIKQIYGASATAKPASSA